MVEQEEMQNYMGHSEVQNRMQNNEMQYIMEEREKGLAEAQLEVDSIKTELYHLLKQDRYEENESGKFSWAEIKDKRERTFSDEGVDKLMQILHFYINKNTLLSNFAEDQIKRLMLKFVREVNDLVLLKYQKLFREPTFKECKEIIMEKMEGRKNMKMFSLEILGKDINEEKIKTELLEEMEGTLEKEMEKIRNEHRKEKLRNYGIMIAQLEIQVFATLNRAYRGEERGSLRRHMNVSELIGSKPNPNQQEGGRGFLSWGRR